MIKLNKELTEKHIEEIARYDLGNSKVFGSAYYVFQKNNFSLIKTYGTLSPDSRTAVDGTTLFRLASMTKPVTAVAALILCDRGLLSLDDKIEDYLPDFRGIHIIDAKGNDYGEAKKAPVIRNLLSHCSGIGSDAEKFSRMTEKDYKSIRSAVEYYIRAGLDFEPESTQLYSPTGAFDVLVNIIEKITGTDYLTFLKNELFIPCEMYDTTFVPDEERKKRIIAMHMNKDGKNAVREMNEECIFENIPMTFFLGGGGLVSSLDDYVKFSKMLLNKGVSVNGSRILSEKTLSAMSTPQFEVSDNQWWGLGVRVITDNSYPYLPKGSFGWSGAYGTHFWVDPENEIIAVFMKNSSVDGGAGNESAVNFEKAVYTSVRE